MSEHWQLNTESVLLLTVIKLINLHPSFYDFISELLEVLLRCFINLLKSRVKLYLCLSKNLFRCFIYLLVSVSVRNKSLHSLLKDLGLILKGTSGVFVVCVAVWRSCSSGAEPQGADSWQDKDTDRFSVSLRKNTFSSDLIKHSQI